MGTKRWQINEKDKQIKLLENQLREAMRVIDYYLDYFDSRAKDALPLKRAKTRIQEMKTENDSGLCNSPQLSEE